MSGLKVYDYTFVVVLTSGCNTV